jgi:hypothetical protein
MKKLRELTGQEQIRMSIEEAGKLYSGHAIIFTNIEDTNGDAATDYGIPRIIGETMAECAGSELLDKYFDTSRYGDMYYCLLYMDSETIPNILIAKG